MLGPGGPGIPSPSAVIDSYVVEAGTGPGLATFGRIAEPATVTSGVVEHVLDCETQY